MIALLSVAIIATGLLPMLLEARRGEASVVNPRTPFVAYYVLLLGCSGIVLAVAGPSPLLRRDHALTPSVYETALWVALAGIVAFQIGYYVQRGTYVQLPRLFLSPWKPGRVLPLVTTCYLIGTIGFLVLLNEAGGVGAFLRDREAWRSGGFKGHGVVLLASTGLMALASHILFIGTVHPATPRRRVALVLLAYAASSIPAAVLGFRVFLLLPYVQLLVLWHFRRRRITMRTLAGLTAAFALAHTAYGLSRDLAAPTSNARASGVRTGRAAQVVDILLRVRGAEVLAEVVERLRTDGDFDTSAQSFVETATTMIPSALWPGKPRSAGERFTTYFFGDDYAYLRGTRDDSFGGVSPTIPAELYWHLGFVGVVAGLFVLGLLVRVLYHTARRSVTRDGALLLFVLCYTTVALMAETVQIYANALVSTVLLLAVVLTVLTVSGPGAGEREVAA